MSDNRRKLSGVFVPLVTPFRSDDLLLDDLRSNLRKLRASKVTGYLALGSNGEFRSLNDREQMQVLEVFAEEKGDKVVMVGTGCESTRQTIEKSRAVAGMGFDFVSVLTPGYFAKRMDGPTLQAHYERVADAVPLPVLIYNAPQFTGGVQMVGSTIVALSRHPNIVGIKDSSPVGPGRFLSDLDPDVDFHVLAGSATFFYASLHLGARGGIISLANVLPDECAEAYRLFVERKYDAAIALHHRLSRLTDAVSGTAGVAGVKAAMEIVGFRGGEPRSPLKAVGDEALEKIRAKMRAEGFLK